MIARLSKKQIIIQEAMNYWDLRDILDHINQVLLTKKYSPQYFFEGTPVMGQGGFSVIIKLDKELGDLEYRVLEKILSQQGIKVFHEK